MSDSRTSLNFLVMERIDRSLNLSRFYVLALEPTLFPGDYAVVREWGRRGQKGRRRVDLFDGRETARCSLETWLQRKVKRGYKVVDQRPE